MACSSSTSRMRGELLSPAVEAPEPMHDSVITGRRKFWSARCRPRSAMPLIDFRLYLPKEWARDRGRHEEAGVPKEVRFATRHELALRLLDEQGALLPHVDVVAHHEGRNHPHWP